MNKKNKNIGLRDKQITLRYLVLRKTMSQSWALTKLLERYKLTDATILAIITKTKKELKQNDSELKEKAFC